MTFNEWVQGRRLRRFVVQMPIWTISYLVVSLVCHWVFRWEFHWVEAIFWGLFMAVTWTIWPPAVARG
jgi:hypothetical protein